MGLATINIRIDEKDKKEFNNLCNELGLNMTTAFNMFVKSINTELVDYHLRQR